MVDTARESNFTEGLDHIDFLMMKAEKLIP